MVCATLIPATKRVCLPFVVDSIYFEEYLRRKRTTMLIKRKTSQPMADAKCERQNNVSAQNSRNKPIFETNFEKIPKL